MEHDEKPLPIDTRLLGALAEKVSFTLCIFGKFSCSHVISVSVETFELFSVSSICKSTAL